MINPYIPATFRRGLGRAATALAPLGSSFQSLLLTAPLLALLGCSDTISDPPPPVDSPRASFRRSFGDSPLRSHIILSTSSSSPWDYSITSTDDPDLEVNGTFTSQDSIPISFEDPGIHEVIVTFSSGSTVVRDTIYGIVNPPKTYEFVRELNDNSPELQGLASTPSAFYTSSKSKIQRRSYESLEVTDSLRLDPSVARELWGLSLSPSGLLYASTDGWGVVEVDPNSMTLIRVLDAPRFADFLIDASSPGNLYVGGERGVARIDIQRGIQAARHFSSGEYFALSNKGVAYVVAGPPPAILFLDSNTLATRWDRQLEFVPNIVGRSSSGTTLYVLGLDSEGDLNFSAFTDDGSLTRHLILEPCQFCFFPRPGSHPVTHVQGLTLIATGNGTYVVDDDRALPIARIGDFPDSRPLDSFFCCNVVSRSNNELYFTINGSLALLRSVTLFKN